jgi:hypothetical protein
MPKQNARPSADTYGFEKGLAVVAKLGLATCFLQAKYNLDNSNVKQLWDVGTRIYIFRAMEEKGLLLVLPVGVIIDC